MSNVILSRRHLLAAAAAAVAVMPAHSAAPWHEAAFLAAKKNIDAICSHPFILGVMDGSLAWERFLWYIQQSRLYLAGFQASARTFAARLPEGADQSWVLSQAAEIPEDKDITARILRDFADPSDVLRLKPLRPTTKKYIDLQKKNAENAPIPVAWATLLPNFWVYGEVGRHVRMNATGSVYSEWLAGYGNTAYDDTVKYAVDLADRLVAAAPAQRRPATNAFLSAVAMEKAFWDAAMALEKTAL